MIATPWMWILFNVFVLLMLALDLGVFHKKAHTVKAREALIWTGVWITLALVFNAGVYFFMGRDQALEFLTGYVIEKSLSVDNIFVFLVIFSYFKIPPLYQHKVLFWGILGALILRAAFIVGGIALLSKFHWVIYVFGGFLIYTGARMLVQKAELEVDPTKNILVRLFKRFMPVTPKMEGMHFFVRREERTAATPLFLALLVVEATDVIFAVDSIPAILAVTQDSFIVYTSNVFAILGLRSLYFALAGAVKMFHYLRHALAAILIFVGGKMAVSDFYKMPILLSLGVIIGLVALGMSASIVRERRLRAQGAAGAS